MAKLAEQLLGNNTGGDRATAGGVKRPRSANAALERPPERLHGQHFIVPVDSSKAKHPPSEIACSARREWEEIAEHLRMRHLLGPSPPSMLQEVASVTFSGHC